MERPCDIQYQNLPSGAVELEHRYGPRVHILSSPRMLTLLARVCNRNSRQPEVNKVIGSLYKNLLNTVVDCEFPRTTIDIETRMIDATERGYYKGQVIDPKTRVAIAAVARAGVMPSQIVFDRLNMMLDPDGVRQDFFFVSRITDKDHHVTGASVYSSKIGGLIDDRYVLLPDPMGATGSSVVQTLDAYRENEAGRPVKIITMHLIVTPEYLKKVLSSYSDIVVYALRLDRGLSSPEVLQTVPGERWDEERGLNENQYIVPGAGGLGELMTNSWV